MSQLFRRLRLRFLLGEEDEEEDEREEGLLVPLLEGLAELALACFRQAQAAWVMKRSVCRRSWLIRHT
jgi:hypothetical protein